MGNDPASGKFQQGLAAGASRRRVREPGRGSGRMTPERWERVCSVFDTALQAPAAKRDAVILHACGDDDAMRTEVTSLLDADARAIRDDFLEPTGHNGFDRARALDANSTQPHVGTSLASDITQEGSHPNVPEGRSTVARGLTSFRILRPHARGGLGEVYVALDEELSREVALKEIQARHAHDPERRARFVQEAVITGSLEHPGIVPVYSLARDGDDRPYYAMRFVRGETLEEAITALHANAVAGGSRPAGGSLALRRLLRRFLDVCDAIAYAHSRGVIHRDIKPSNVMLGPFGETLVLDWGLAKWLGQPSPEVGPAPISASASSVWETQPGSVLGTPRYMSPEQAAGDPAQVGVASDVYSLGATLYHLLTGSPPFADSDHRSVLKKLQEGDFQQPREVRADVPAPLEAICVKAMALDPRRRYLSPRDLASDLERWLDDMPVSVHRDVPLVRLARWGRGHKPVLAGASALVATALVALTISTVLIARESSRREEQRRLAEVNFVKARDAVDRMLTEVGEVELADVPQMERVRQRLLRSALAFYTDFLNQKGNDPRLRRELARAGIRLAQVQDLLGAGLDAEQSYRRAIALLETGVTEPRADLACAWDGLGMVLKKVNQFREAEDALRQGLRRRGELAAERPQDPGTRAALAESGYHLATLLARVSGRGPEDERAYRDAVALQQRLVADSRGDLESPELRARLGRYLNNLGLMVLVSGRLGEAETFLNEAKSIQEKLSAVHPSNPGYRWHQARALGNLGVLCQTQGQAGKAETSLEAARTLLARLADEFPSIPDYRRELASIHNNLGRLHAAAGRRETAKQAYQQAIELQRRLADEFPLVPGDRQRLATTRLNLALLRISVDPSAAELDCRDVVEEHRQIVESYPKVPEYRQALGRALYALARCLVSRGACDEAGSALNQAIEHHRAALASPRDQAGLVFLRDDYGVLAHALLAAGDHAGAAAAAAELPRLLPDALEEYLGAAAFLVTCSDQARSDRRRAPRDQERLSEVYSRQAVEWIRRAVDHGLIMHPRVLDRRELEPLRGRADFNDVRSLLSARINPPQG
jgi:serine/threonine-protein kinase